MIILIAIIGGGAGAYFLLRTSVTGGTADFGVSVLVGDPNRPSGTWQKVDQTTGILLNGTSKSFVIVVDATGSFNEFVNLSFSGTITGLTSHFSRTTVLPATAASDSSGLTLTAASDVATRKDPYNLNVTGTTPSGSVTHSAIFPVWVRSTTIFLDPPTMTVPNNNLFQVGLKIRNVYNLTAFQINIGYNTSLVNATKVSLSYEFDPVNGFAFAPPEINKINNTLGQVSIGSTLLGQCVISVQCVTVEGAQEYIIANVTFGSNVTFTGDTALSLTNEILYAVNGDVPIAYLPHHTMGGSVSVNLVSGPDPTIIKAGLDPAWYGPLILGVAVASLVTVGPGVRVFRRPRKHS